MIAITNPIVPASGPEDEEPELPSSGPEDEEPERLFDEDDSQDFPDDADLLPDVLPAAPADPAPAEDPAPGPVAAGPRLRPLRLRPVPSSPSSEGY